MAKRNAMGRVHEKMSPGLSPRTFDSGFIGEARSPGLSPLSPASVYYSPDKKINPYTTEIEDQKSPQQIHETPNSTTRLVPQPELQFPHRTYIPADYAPKSPLNPHSPIDTSTIGPGPNQWKDHSLHDAFFPPPPPRASPVTLSAFTQFQSLNQPPLPPQPQPEGLGITTGVGVVKRLDPHHRNAPSIAIPVPKKKSMEAHRAEEEMIRAQIDDFEAQELAGKGKEEERERGEGEPGIESPTVFYYDAMSGKYMKETSPR